MFVVHLMNLNIFLALVFRLRQPHLDCTTQSFTFSTTWTDHYLRLSFTKLKFSMSHRTSENRWLHQSDIKSVSNKPFSKIGRMVLPSQNNLIDVVLGTQKDCQLKVRHFKPLTDGIRGNRIVTRFYYTYYTYYTSISAICSRMGTIAGLSATRG